MNSAETHILGLFKSEDQAAESIRELAKSPYSLKRTNTPFPSHKIMDALKLKPSKVGLFTLVGGITGFLSGFLLAIFTATRWNLIVSGKPIISLIPFFIVGFEFTILFAVFGNFIGLLTQARLPSFKGLDQYYDPRCSGEYFGVLAACQAGQQDGLKQLFEKQGGEIKEFNETI
jgi:molybdopterin-containing oxidoreductase family membrane subunit